MVSSVSRRRATVCKLSGQRERKQATNYQLCFKDRAHPGGGVDFAGSAFRRQARRGLQDLSTQVVSDPSGPACRPRAKTARKLAAEAGQRVAGQQAKLMTQLFRDQNKAAMKVENEEFSAQGPLRRRKGGA